MFGALDRHIMMFCRGSRQVDVTEADHPETCGYPLYCSKRFYEVVHHVMTIVAQVAQLVRSDPVSARAMQGSKALIGQHKHIPSTRCFNQLQDYCEFSLDGLLLLQGTTPAIPAAGSGRALLI